MTAPAMQEPKCPKCGSAMYDNRASNYQKLQEGKKLGPDWKCKQYKSGCAGVIWPPTNSTPAAPPPGPALVTTATTDPYAPQKKSLAQLYTESLTFVLKTVVPLVKESGIEVNAQAVSTMTATIFIARREQES